MNSHQEQKLNELIRSSFPIKNGIVDFISKEIRKLYRHSFVVGREETLKYIDAYLKNNKQEYFYKKCVDLLKP